MLVDPSQTTGDPVEAFASPGEADKWLSIVTHELKNSLNTILNAVWLLRNRSGQNSERLLELIERSTRQMEAQVGELRRVGRAAFAAPPSARTP